MEPTRLSILLVLALVVNSLTPCASMVVTEETSERLNRWKARWDDNNLGWHRDGVHGALLQLGETIIPNFKNENEDSCPNPVRVFFPLCGKTNDMAFLAKHPAVSQVVGVDGIRKALEEFATANPDLQVDIASKHDVISNAQGSTSYERLTGKKISLLKGDFFGLDETATNGQFEAIFDRASMVAIDPTLRKDYVSVLGRLLKPGGKILLVSVERRSGTEEDKMGPPFSLTEAHIRELYEGLEWVESVSLVNENGDEDGDREKSRISMHYLIQSKQS